MHPQKMAMWNKPNKVSHRLNHEMTGHGGNFVREDDIRQFIKACRSELATGSRQKLQAITYLVDPDNSLTYWEIADQCRLPVEEVFELQEEIDYKPGHYHEIAKLYQLMFSAKDFL